MMIALLRAADATALLPVCGGTVTFIAASVALTRGAVVLSVMTCKVTPRDAARVNARAQPGRVGASTPVELPTECSGTRASAGKASSGKNGQALAA